MKKCLIFLGAILLFIVVGIHAVWGSYYQRCLRMKEELNDKIGNSGESKDGYVYHIAMPGYLEFNGGASVGSGVLPYISRKQEEVLIGVSCDPKLFGKPDVSIMVYRYYTDSMEEGKIFYKFDRYIYEVDEDNNRVVLEDNNRKFFEAHREEILEVYDRAIDVWSSLR